MKKIILIALALMTVLTGCTSTKNPVSNEKLQEDCLKIQDIHNNLTELVGFKVDSTAISTDSFVARVTIDLKTAQDTVSAKVIMHYKKYKQSWYLNANEIKILSVISQAMPTVEMVKERAQTLNFLYKQYEAYSFLDTMTVTEKSNTGNGIVAFDFSIEGSEALWNYHSEGIIEASYKLGQRWTYAIVKDSYTETSDWTGVYRIYPNNTFVSEGWVDPDMFDMTITGNCTQTADQSGTNDINCDLSASFTYKGIKYNDVYGQVSNHSSITNSRNILFGVDDSLVFELSRSFEGRISDMMLDFTGKLNSEVAAVIKIK